MEEKIKINFCKCCKKCGKGCLNVEIREIDDVKIYRCTNYECNIELPEYMKNIKFAFYDEDGNYIAILKNKVNKDEILELRKHFDFVKYDN